MKYQVSQKVLDSKGRVEWQRVSHFATKKAAIKKAMQVSKLSGIIETDVVGTDDNEDIIFHAFYGKGKLKIQMI